MLQSISSLLDACLNSAQKPEDEVEGSMRMWHHRAQWSIITRRRDWNLIAILVALGLFLDLYGIWWGLPYPPGVNPIDASWALDTIAPVQPLAAAKEGFSWGMWLSHEFTYPLGHYMVLAASYAPYVGYLYLSGGLGGASNADYPYGLTDPVTALTTFTLIARIVSAMMATGIVWITFLIVRELFERRAAFFAALIVAVCYPLIFYAHGTSLDVPYVFWTVLALYAYTLVMNVGYPRHYLALGIFAGMALATKDQAYALLIMLPLPVLWFHYRRRASTAVNRRCWTEHLNFANLVQSVKGKEIPLGIGGFAVTYVVANNLLLNFPRFVLHTRALIARRGYDRVLDPTTLEGHVRLFLETLSYLARSMNLPLCVLSLVGLAYCLYRYPRRSWPYLVPLASYYGLFIAGSAFYVHSRHVVPLAILLAFSGGKMLSDLVADRRLHRGLRYGFVGVLFIYSLVYGFSQDLTLINDPRAQAHDWIQAHVPPGSVIEVYSLSTFLPHFSSAYHIQKVDFAENGNAQDLRARHPDYIVVTEHEYRISADYDEGEALARELRDKSYLSGLWNGSLGYELAVSFKYKLHDWFFADIIYAQNPRNLVFQQKND